LKIHGATDVKAVNTAYWLNSDRNRMDIPPGHQKSVILGHFNGDRTFDSYENEYSYSINSAWPASRQLADAISVSVERVIIIEIAIIESTNQHRTIDKVVVEIDVATKNIQVIQSLD
jgi:hypothetical protein